MKLFALLASLGWAMEECKDTAAYSSPSKNKPGFCTDVTMYHKRTNSWVCKDCFNIRIEFNLKWIGAVGHWWDNRDYIWIAFKQPVSVIKFAGPSDGVVPDGRDADGNYRFKVGFNSNFNPGDKRIDINIGLLLATVDLVSTRNLF